MNILGRLTLTLVVLFTVSVCTTVALYPDSNGPIKVIHAFSGGDGAKSKGSLSLVQCPPYKQVLYGFTAEGGKFGGGVVFAAGFVGSVVDGASFAVVHDFEVPQTRKSKDQNATDVDGYEPHHGALTPDCKRGLLFGTALGGGSANEGVIFSVGLAPPHTFSVLHAFDAGPKHGGPHSGLIAGADGRLYGVTCSGGDHSSGSLFRYDPDKGSFRTLYSFPSKVSKHGRHPHGSLSMSPDGRHLYGVARYGGFLVNGSEAFGTLFAYDLKKDSVSVLHTFVGGADDGATSEHGGVSSVKLDDGTLYLIGTTTNGGASNVGTLFRVSPDGTDFAVLHSFGNASGPGLTGEHPYGTPIVVGGHVCGTTRDGGVKGKGSVYCVTIGGSWFASTVASFHKNKTGQHPIDNLVQVSGLAYGLTESGGPNNANGTLFSVIMPAAA